MVITHEVFEAYLHCPTKCHLVATGFEAVPLPFRLQLTLRNDAYRREGVRRLCAGAPARPMKYSSVCPHWLLSNRSATE